MPSDRSGTPVPAPPGGPGARAQGSGGGHGVGQPVWSESVDSTVVVVKTQLVDPGVGEARRMAAVTASGVVGASPLSAHAIRSLS